MSRAVEYGDCYHGLRKFQTLIHQWAVEKGWVTGGQQRNPLEMLMLIVSELGECAEAFRNGNPPCPKCSEISSVGEELADAVIRIFQMAEEQGIDLANDLLVKQRFNEGRQHRHGGKLY